MTGGPKTYACARTAPNLSQNRVDYSTGKPGPSGPRLPYPRENRPNLSQNGGDQTKGHRPPPRRHHCTVSVHRDAVMWIPYLNPER